MITYWPTMERCAAIAKKELNYVGPFGLVAGLCGTIFIRRNLAKDSHATMNEAAELVKQKKVKCTVACLSCPIGIFTDLEIWSIFRFSSSCGYFLKEPVEAEKKCCRLRKELSTLQFKPNCRLLPWFIRAITFLITKKSDLIQAR